MDVLHAIQETLSGTPLAAALANTAQVKAKVKATIAAAKRRLTAAREALAQAFGDRHGPIAVPWATSSHVSSSES
jgi:hypothetical protein